MERAEIGELFTAAADGDSAAWKGLVEGLAPLVWSIARSYRLSDADARDVFATTWFKLVQHLGRIREPDKVGAWLASTARHEALKMARSVRPVPLDDHPALLDLSSAAPTPEEVVVEAERQEAAMARARVLWQVVRELSDTCQRLVRVLMTSPPPSYAEISAATGLAVGSIGPIRARCFGRLRTLLAEQGVA
ncbi:RNA polymerase sigma factor [Herbidospora mongoliensis]|uniref:RNA polymerase sigma factor n=1 Tax=Herbidospora mongoliensis TaxID=688067 RepID=UPI00082964F1|nr:sigma-70 family RNA polymerase sigma factor [Herbidospora mongoliensis]